MIFSSTLHLIDNSLELDTGNYESSDASYASRGSRSPGVDDTDSRWIASEKSTRIPISTFQTALNLHGVEVDTDEVECMVANMIYRVSQALDETKSTSRAPACCWCLVTGLFRTSS
jgi:hypothetical protein